MTATLTVSCIGLGRMGSGIARNIQRTGFPLTVYNRTMEKTRPFVAAGAQAANSPREAAAAADVVVTNLMDDESVIATLMGDNGILAGMRPGGIHIGTTTISPRVSTRLAALHKAQGSFYIAAPVGGRPDAAAAGQLFTFVAGESAAIERALPVLKSYTQRMMPMGEDHAIAMSVKLMGNFFVASLLEVMGETYVFAEKRGVPTEFVTNLLKTFLPMGSEYVDRISKRQFGDAGFALDAGLKDVRLMLDATAEVQAPLPLASLVRDRLVAAQAHGLGDQDWSAFTEMARIDAGQERTDAGGA